MTQSSGLNCLVDQHILPMTDPWFNHQPELEMNLLDLFEYDDLPSELARSDAYLRSFDTRPTTPEEEEGEFMDISACSLPGLSGQPPAESLFKEFLLREDQDPMMWSAPSSPTKRTHSDAFCLDVQVEEDSRSQSRHIICCNKMSRLNRLRELELKMNEARKLNVREAAVEEERKKRPQNWENKRKRSEWEEDQDKMKKHCKETGEDFEIARLRDLGADEVERWERKKKRKNPDTGFADYEQATHRQHMRLTKPDMQGYERQREKMGDEFCATANTLGLHQRKDHEENVDKMVLDLEKQIEKRVKYSRRRRFDEEEDVSYINERNMKFNRKLERFYGQYTAEIKQNLERGTAV